MLLLLALLTTTTAGAAPGAGAALRPILEASRREHRPIVLRIRGQAIPGVVVRLQETSVEVRRPDHTRLLIRLDRLEAAVPLDAASGAAAPERKS
ncbi:MAG: hypothetical protein U0P81_15245 [Holophagaceae bacterium]